MPYPNEHAARQLDPGKFKRIRRSSSNFPKGISVLFGILPDGKVKIQSIRFNRRYWTVEQAKRWLKKHGYKSNVEAATNKSINWGDIL